MKSSRYRYTAQRYECKQGHVSEIVVEDRQRFQTRKCRQCGKKAEHVRIAKTINALPRATLICEKLVDGQVKRMYVDPAYPDSVAHARERGFTQIREIQGAAEMRRFQREVTNDMRREWSRKFEGEHKRKQEFYEQFHSDLRGIQNQCGNQFTRDFLQAVIDDTPDHHKQFDPEFFCRAYE